MTAELPHVLAVERFVDAVRQWAYSVELREFTKAERRLDAVRRAGIEFASEPRFSAAAKASLRDCCTQDLTHALDCVCGLLRAVTDTVRPGSVK